MSSTLRMLQQRIVQERLVDEQREVSLPRRLYQLAGFGGGHGQGLLDPAMPAGGKHVARERVVRRWRCGHEHRIDVVPLQQLARAADRVDVGYGGPATRITVADRLDAYAIEVPEGPEQLLAPVAGPNQSESQHGQHPPSERSDNRFWRK